MTKSCNKVLFLCTGNSARSQIAEAIVNSQLGDTWEAFSAGTHPAKNAHPMAIKVLQEINIQHNGKPKHVEEFKNQSFDLVITICDSAAEECPLWLGSGIRFHIGFPDPAKVIGSEDEQIEAFRKVRDGISEKIVNLLKQYTPSQ